MSSSLPETVTVRAATDADVPAVTELVQAAERDVHGRTSIDADGVRDWWRLIDLPTGSWVFEEAGRLVAFGGLMPRGEATNFWATVRPGDTGRGLGTALLELAEDHTRKGDCRTLRVGTYAENARAIELLGSRGYRDARHYYLMHLDLTDAPPEPEWPDGIVGDSLRPGEERAFHGALNEAFAEEWGWVAMEFDEWRERRIDDSDFDPRLFLVARAGDELAAVARCESRESGGFVASIGVRPPWRRRGVGLALLRAAFVEFHDRGHDCVRLGVDAENPTGATRLYERAGMHVEHEEIAFERELD